MNKKIIISILIGIIVLIAICTSLLTIHKESSQIINHTHAASHEKKSKVQKEVIHKETTSDKYELYVSDVNIPFITMFNLSKLSTAEKEKAKKIIADYQNSDIMVFDRATHKFIIILPYKLGNRKIFDRHNFEILEVALNNCGIHTMTIGFSGLDGETANSIEGFVTENETWEFDRSTEIAKPLKHAVLNEDGKVEYEETWNYGEDEPVKYEIKDGEGHTISILKETFADASTYDKEHIFYDDKGQTEMLVSIHYEGANITRLTYYNVNDKENSFTIISEYTDGVKTSEKVYNTDYALISDIKAEYKDGQISALEQNNGSEKEVIKK